jgi:hypothetical protein
MKKNQFFKKHLWKICTVFLISVPSIASAQNQNAILGQPSQINLTIPNVSNLDKCHIEVTLPNQQKAGIVIDGPQFNAAINFTPDQIGNTLLKWEGKRRNRGLNSVNACPGSGEVQISVKGNAEYITKQWNEYFAKVPEVVGECVKFGMDISQIKYLSLADPNALLTAPDDQNLKPIYDKCDSFARQNQPRKTSPCVLSNQNNLNTICDGLYAERQADGRLISITRSTAFQLHFEGKPWTIGTIENSDARVARLKREEEEKAKQAVNIAAQKEAQERDRKLKESPEYKKQQAELELKRLAEEKRLAALKAKEEQEREIREKNERAALDAQRAQEEKLRQQRQATGISDNIKSTQNSNKNFLIGLCIVTNPDWEKFKCNINSAMYSDEMTVLFQTFEDASVVLNLVFGVKCDKILGQSRCVNKTFRGGASYELLSNGTIIQNTLADGCIVPNKYSMESGILYSDYGGEARGTCKEEQVLSARRLKEIGKRRVYYVKK